MRLADPEPLLLDPPVDPLTEGLAHLRAPEPDHEQAVYWLRVAADAGSAEALAMLAFCQLEGLGLPRDAVQARERLERAAAEGSMDAKFHLGRALVAGWGGPPDAPRGVALYTAAAAQYHPDATFNLAACLDAGWGCQPDRLAAKALFLRARALGSPLKAPGVRVRQRELDGMRRLARRFEHGDALARLIEERQHEITLMQELVQQPAAPLHRARRRRLLGLAGITAVVAGAAAALAGLLRWRAGRALAHDAGPHLHRLTRPPMPALPLATHLADVGPLVYGCMALGGDWGDSPVSEADIAQAHAAVEAALAIGVTLFDHADIYRRGKAEAVFGELLRRDAGLRGRVRLQSKCGIRFADDAQVGRYDLSAAYIERSVDGILQRLGVERLDILLLHRPDALMEPAEVAAAFARLQAAGKVAHLGVSNMHAGQMRWLQTALDQPLVVNQLELSLAKLDAIDVGTTFNDPQAAARPGGMAWAGTLEYAQQHGVQLQAWGSLAQGRFNDAGASPAAKAVHEIAEAHRTTPNAVLLAWLLRHPAGIQPVIGSGNAERIRACADATKLQLSREEWYRLYVTARGQALP